MVKINTTRLTALTVILGSVYVIWMLFPSPRLYASPMLLQTQLLVFFGIWVLAPLSFKAAAQADRNGKYQRLYVTIVICQFIATVLAFHIPLSVRLEDDSWVYSILYIWTFLWLVSWIISAVLIGLSGVLRLLQRAWTPIEELCIDVGLMYSLIGAGWLLMYLLNVDPFNFGFIVVLLTANHFTFIGFGALLITGMVGRHLKQTGISARVWRWYRWTATGVIIAPLVVGSGIAFSHTVEVVGVIFLAVSLLSLAALMLAFVARSVNKPVAKELIAVAAGWLILGMAFALAYGIGRYTGWWQISLDTMVQFHGRANALGFSFLGVVAWLIVRPQARSAAPGIPFSRLRGRGQIGPQFFERIGALDTTKTAPTGIVDNLSDYAREDFDPEQTDPQVRAFYEHTAQHRLEVTPVWRSSFRAPARLYKRMSSAVSQMNFPLEGETAETLIHSEIVPLSDKRDGRQNVRGWVRVYQNTGRAVYVAAYANHSYNGQTYMNIAFPLPFANMTSILRIDALTTDNTNNGVALTSKTTPQTIGDQGVYLVTRWLSIRLPINEVIRVYPAGSLPDDAPAAYQASPQMVFAQHDMWLFGVKFLTLYYAISILQT